MTIGTESTTFDAYLKWQGVNASWLGHAFKSWKQFHWVLVNGYQPKTDTRVGTALHSLAEVLPLDVFDTLFQTMPDFKTSPDNVTTTGKPSTSQTSWVKEQEAALIAENPGSEFMSVAESKRCRRMLFAIQTNDEAMSLITNSLREVSITGELHGVACKSRLDGIRIEDSVLWDLKSTRDVSPHQFGRTAANLHYVFKTAFYWLMLRQNGIEATEVKLIAVQDSVPVGDGSFNEAADCVVYPVPMIAIENQFAEIERLLTEYKRCVDMDLWPGVQGQPLVIPNWAMGETELV